MREIRIMVRCVSEPKKHAKVVRVKAKLGKRRAQELADLLDGSSLAYVHPPADASPIGRCCICHADVECEVSEIIGGVEMPPTVEEAQEDRIRKDKKAERKLAGVLKNAS